MEPKSDVIIGLEIHVQLKTKSKLFCGCPISGSGEPNSRVCPICLGHPGSKPVVNRMAVLSCLKLALTLKCEIAKDLIFSRKSYFYPDLSKNYQITQFEIPLGKGGEIILYSGKRIRLRRVHLEEDPASLVHPEGVQGSKYVLVDYNRSGNPLAEIVTEPDLESALEAREFMKQLMRILTYLKISDESVKADVNVSIRESGYTRVEIKNITGFKEIESAIVYEVLRQKKEGDVRKETRAWDAENQRTYSLRSKESEEDYSYIIDPDLVPISLEPMIPLCDIPELSSEKSKRFIKEYGIAEDDAYIIAAQLEISEMFERVAKEIDPVLAARWFRRELFRVMNEMDFVDLKIDEKNMAQLLSLVERGEVTENVARKLLRQLAESPFDVREYVKKNNLSIVKDQESLSEYARIAIEENPQAVKDFLSGKEKSLNFLMGRVMKQSKGTASPGEILEILRKLMKDRK